jgi:hypothetical protein
MVGQLCKGGSSTGPYLGIIVAMFAFYMCVVGVVRDVSIGYRGGGANHGGAASLA